MINRALADSIWYICRWLTLISLLAASIPTCLLAFDSDSFFTEHDRSKVTLKKLSGRAAPSAFVCDSVAYFPLATELRKLITSISKDWNMNIRHRKRLADQILHLSRQANAEVLSLELLQWSILSTEFKYPDQLRLERFVLELRAQLLSLGLRLPARALSPELIAETNLAERSESSMLKHLLSTIYPAGKLAGYRLHKLQNADRSIDPLRIGIDDQSVVFSSADIPRLVALFARTNPHAASKLARFAEFFGNAEHLNLRIMDFRNYAAVIKLYKIETKVGLEFYDFLNHIVRTTDPTASFAMNLNAEELRTALYVEAAQSNAQFRQSEAAKVSAVTLQLREKALQWLKEDDRHILSDFINAEWLKDHEIRGSYHLLVGNQFDEVSEAGKQDIALIVRGLLANSINIVFDADSGYAELISSIAGPAAIGVTGQKKYMRSLDERTPLITIQNVFLRMERLLETNGGSIIADTSSPTGAAGLIQKDVRHLLLPSPANTSPSDFRRLFYPDLRIVSGAVDFLRSSFGINDVELTPVADARTKKLKQPNLIDYVNTLDRWTLEHIIASAEDLRQKLATADHVAEGVVFCSGSDEPKHESLARATARVFVEQGWGLVTGGARGLMKVVNEEVFTAGGTSIGIAIDPSSGASLRNENSIPTNIHTSTILTKGYTTRIPLLLHDRKLASVMMGHRGTRKELAASLVMLATGLSSTEVALVAPEVYTPYLDQLGALHLPQHIMSRFHRIDTANDMRKLIVRLKTKDRVTENAVRCEANLIESEVNDKVSTKN